MADRYVIRSVRLGKPGAVFRPPDGVNVRALVKARLIEPAAPELDDDAPVKKPAKKTAAKKDAD